MAKLYKKTSPKTSTPLHDEDILNMRRSDIRYALYRCKKGNGVTEHKLILAYYQDQLDDVSCDISDFAETDGWDVNKKDFTDVVTGKIVRKYIKDLLAPAS
jgi:hypothetical protein